ncbi:MAG: TolC family protein [Akkermansiaceae bacterium]|nr:TolC family protein [Akkermansiaceae bacterium]MCP5550945.1 TolC family protein [Akkermansiaceae bacterium]
MLEYEPELQAAAWDTEAANQSHKMVRGEMLPQVGIHGSAGASDRDRSLDGVESGNGQSLFSRQVGASLRQLLWDFGQTAARTKSARHNAALQDFLERSMNESRAVDLTEVYLEILRVREQINLAKRNLENHNEIAKMLRTRFENGGDAADLALVEGREELARTTLETQLLSLSLAEGRYARLTGELPGSLHKPTTPSLPSTRESLDLSSNWNVLAAKEGVAMAEENRKADHRENLPKLYADLGYTAGEDVLGIPGRDNEARALVTLSWNIFNSGINQARAKRGDALEYKAVELARAAELERDYQLSVLWGEMRGASATVDALSGYSDRLSKVGKDYDEQFRIGKRDLLNILDVKNEHYTATSRLLDARYNELGSRFRILGLQGRLVSSLLGGEGGKAPSADGPKTSQNDSRRKSGFQFAWARKDSSPTDRTQKQQTATGEQPDAMTMAALPKVQGAPERTVAGQTPVTAAPAPAPAARSEEKSDGFRPLAAVSRLNPIRLGRKILPRKGEKDTYAAAELDEELPAAGMP